MKSGKPVAPLHRGHRPNQQVGWATAEERGIVIELMEEHAITEAALFGAFGNCGFKVLERTPDGRVLRARIMEWSTS